MKLSSRQRITALFAALVFAGQYTAHAQDNFFSRWQARASATQARQPGWSTPVIAPYPMLIQVFRAEFVRQIAPARTQTWNYGDTKGLNLIPFARTEFDVYMPPYLQHNSKAKDGFGDASFLAKYRILSGNEKSGNYIVSAALLSTIPTGSYSNGAADATVTPQLSAGKGFGHFDVFSTIAGTLPVHNGEKAGRPIASNTVAQYRLGKYVIPEVEDNATFYQGGSNDGKTQNFVSPGLMLGKFKLQPHDARARSGFSFGAGEQIATSQFHTYNHALYLTGRFLF
jgi:hypothetical protein